MGLTLVRLEGGCTRNVWRMSQHCRCGCSAHGGVWRRCRRCVWFSAGACYYLCQQAQRAWFGPCLNTGTDLALVVMVSTFALHISHIGPWGLIRFHSAPDVPVLRQIVRRQTVNVQAMSHCPHQCLEWGEWPDVQSKSGGQSSSFQCRLW